MRGFAFSPLGNLQKLDLSGIRTSFESGEGRGAPVECESLTQKEFPTENRLSSRAAERSETFNWRVMGIRRQAISTTGHSMEDWPQGPI